MEAHTELEEGEACYYKDTDEGNVDLDSLSYMDERIQHALGHFQKDFEGGVTAENLGARFGGYGSFLPTYERSPYFRSHSKIPQRNHNSPKSPINVHIEAVSHNTEAPSNVPPSARLGKAVAPSVDNSVLKGRRISSGDAAERCTLKDDTTKKTGNSTDQRPLKFPIKMKSHILAQKKAAIYSGLGLDISPSSSMENSPVESEGMPPVSQENTENSPTAIIQVMTSCHIPGGVLISPLHESFLSLIEEEKVIQDNIYMSPLNGHQEPFPMSTDELDSFAEDGHLKKRNGRIVRQNEKQLQLKNMNETISEEDMTLHTKKRFGNRTPDFNDLKRTPLSSSICDAGETAEVTAKASEVSKEVAAPQLIAEWVCCDSCDQWRLLPTGIKPNQLPEEWFCSMLNWLPGMNSCDFSQDDTTNALYALQSHANGTAIGVSSADALQCGPSLKKSGSDVKSDQGRKKHVIKEKTMPRIKILSKSGKLNAPESGKNKRLINMNQHPADSDPMKKLIDEKDMPKEKEKHINGGDRKHIKLKRKMDADQCRSGTPKRSKTDVFHADKQLNPGMGHEKVALNSGNGFPTKASGRDRRKPDEYCFSEDVQDKLLVPVKKEGDQAQVSYGGEPLGVKNCSKSDGSMKKRKLKGWLDNEKHNNTYSLYGDEQCGEEDNSNKFRKEKKCRIFNEDAKSGTSSSSKGSRSYKAKANVSGKDDSTKCGLSSTGPRRCEDNREGKQSVKDGSNGNGSKLMRNFGDVSSNNGVNHSSGNFSPNQQLTLSSSVRKNSSHTAVKTLEEATKLKVRAHHYKECGFDFESNETYFKAGLKFLHGASLLENCHGESSKHGEMSQMQIYATAAELFKSCAYEYESCQEMAAAALAYKCMEVAYMRVVCCKNSSIIRDQHELQSTLPMVSQGESPSSSASDVVNLHNQTAMDKATLTKGTTGPDVAGDQAISARTLTTLVRLFDFTQDIDFAMEASRKCQSAFTAAKLITEEAARNTDCITSIRRVIGFSFQDLDELVRLVWIATKAISGAGLGGA